MTADRIAQPTPANPRQECRESAPESAPMAPLTADEAQDGLVTYIARCEALRAEGLGGAIVDALLVAGDWRLVYGVESLMDGAT